MSNTVLTSPREYESDEWISFEDDQQTTECREVPHDGGLIALEPVFESLQDMKDAPIVLLDDAAQTFARVKQRRRPRAANPVSFD
jgi:hypothetical protein